jgi:hypothetical protein
MWVVMAALAIGCGGSSGSDVGTDPGTDNPGVDADVTQPDVPGDTIVPPDAVEDSTDAIDDVPAPLRDIPYAPPPFANPLVDRPFVQEINHTWNEVEPGIGALIAVLLPPAGLAGTYDTPTQVTPRGLVTHDAGGALHVLTIPEADRDLVGAAFLPDGILLAGPQRLYTRDGDSLVAHELPTPPVDTGDLVAVDPGRNRIFLRAAGPHVGILTSVDPGTWAATIAWTPWSNVTALAETADTVFVAMWDMPAQTHQAIVAAIDPYLFANPPTYPDPLPTPAIALSTTGPVRALVIGVTFPLQLDVAAVGDEGLAGLRYSESLFTLVDVPLFAADRVPLDLPTAATRTADGGFLVATKGGAYRLRDVGLGPEWHMYGQERWLPEEDVRGVATDAGTIDAPLYFATAGGLGSVTTQTLTVETKMAGIIDRIVTRHDRDGAVADSNLATPGDLSTSIPYDSDNDGGWTCYWVLAECFRWKVTGDPAAKAHFDKSLDRMLSFRTLTGTDWFVARSVIRKEGCILDDCDNPNDGEWFTSPDGEWWVKSDTSNDEVTSHMFMMGHAYDVCADTDQKARIREHVRGIVGGLIDHGYKLLKPDGVETTYGQFDPDYVNGVVGQLGDGGRRSVQMLAALDLALYMTGDAKFAEAKRYLIEEQHYDENVRTESEYPGRRGSGDGDELGMQAFFVLLRYETDPALYATFLDGWHRTYANIRLQEAALWDVVNGVLGGEAPAFENALRWLRLVPVDGIRWPMHNLQRKDLAPPPDFYRRQDIVRWQRSDGHPLPVDERPLGRHNGPQYEVDGGWGSNREIDGADVVASYWMGRYHGFFTMPPVTTP